MEIDDLVETFADEVAGLAVRAGRLDGLLRRFGLLGAPIPPRARELSG